MGEKKMARLTRFHLFVSVLSVALVLGGCSNSSEKDTVETSVAKEPQEQLTLENIRAPALGPEDAPVVIYEVSNFT
jgi:PBP1b-binding outer membrane lipoprotein LpoB